MADNVYSEPGATEVHITHLNNTRTLLQTNLDACQFGYETDQGFWAYKDHLGAYHTLSIADALAHGHSSLMASDGNPANAVTLDAAGKLTVGNPAASFADIAAFHGFVTIYGEDPDNATGGSSQLRLFNNVDPYDSYPFSALSFWAKVKADGTGARLGGVQVFKTNATDDDKLSYMILQSSTVGGGRHDCVKLNVDGARFYDNVGIGLTPDAGYDLYLNDMKINGYADFYKNGFRTRLQGSACLGANIAFTIPAFLPATSGEAMVCDTDGTLRFQSLTHAHSSLAASDGSPDPALSIDANGKAIFQKGISLIEAVGGLYHTDILAQEQSTNITLLLPNSPGTVGQVLTIALVSGTEITLEWA